MGQALHSPFFLSLSVPLPGSSRRTAEFIRDSNPEQVALFWDTQLSRLGGLIEASSVAQSEWLNFTPSQTAPAAGKLQLPALMALSAQCGLGGSIWLQQFLYGSPSIGRLAQPRCYPSKPNEVRKREDPIPKALKSSANRFSDMARKSGFKNAKAFWAEALDQCDKGWMSRPFPLCSERARARFPIRSLKLLFRFGVEQSNKLRACDDLRFPRTDLSCVVETPIKIFILGHLAELAHVVNDESRGWSFP